MSTKIYLSHLLRYIITHMCPYKFNVLNAVISGVYNKDTTVTPAMRDHCKYRPTSNDRPLQQECGLTHFVVIWVVLTHRFHCIIITTCKGGSHVC